MGLASSIGLLRRHYGPPRSPAPVDPFALLLWEYVAYLADDAKRAAVFKELKATVGVRPAEVLAAPTAVLGDIARKGGSIAVSERAARMKEAAAAVRDTWGGSLRPVMALPYHEARRALQKFPSIGPPGADKILVLTGAQAVLALDSNALRVLLRLGYGRKQKSYGAMYASAQAAASAELSGTVPALRDASLLLQQHGRELCRRTDPRCSSCPLDPVCPKNPA